MNSNIHLRKVNLRSYFKTVSHYIWFNGPIDVIDRTSFTEFGGKLGDKQRPTLERIDMKLSNLMISEIIDEI